MTKSINYCTHTVHYHTVAKIVIKSLGTFTNDGFFPEKSQKLERHENVGIFI